MRGILNQEQPSPCKLITNYKSGFLKLDPNVKELAKIGKERRGTLEKNLLLPNFISYRLNHVKKLTRPLLDSLRVASKEYPLDYRIIPITKGGELYLIDIRMYFSD